ncbi:MAG TPA: antibiotic biosynthesis monooxygenase [Candidatus Paceibacterota bacterium]
MNQELLCIARLKIKPGKLEEFKKFSAMCDEVVRTKDTGTLEYKTYMSADNTACVVIERYKDSQALLDHFKNLGDLMGDILQTCSGEGEVLGNPSPEILANLKNSPVKPYWPFNF